MNKLLLTAAMLFTPFLVAAEGRSVIFLHGDPMAVAGEGGFWEVDLNKIRLEKNKSPDEADCLVEVETGNTNGPFPPVHYVTWTTEAADGTSVKHVLPVYDLEFYSRNTHTDTEETELVPYEDIMSVILKICWPPKLAAK